MPLTTENIFTFGAKQLEPFMYPHLTKIIPVQLTDITNDTLAYYKRGTVFSQITATKKYSPYDNSTAGGRNVASCILVRDTVVYKQTGKNQKYWFGSYTTAFPGPHGEFVDNIPMYFGGCFLTSDLYIGAGSADDTATRLDSTNTNDLVDTLAALADLNATTVMLTDIAADPDVTCFRF